MNPQPHPAKYQKPARTPQEDQEYAYANNIYEKLPEELPTAGEAYLMPSITQHINRNPPGEDQEGYVEELPTAGEAYLMPSITQHINRNPPGEDQEGYVEELPTAGEAYLMPSITQQHINRNSAGGDEEGYVEVTTLGRATFKTDH